MNSVLLCSFKLKSNENLCLSPALFTTTAYCKSPAIINNFTFTMADRYIPQHCDIIIHSVKCLNLSPFKLIDRLP